MESSNKYHITYPNLQLKDNLINTGDRYEVDYICQVAGITFANEDGEFRQQIISEYFRKSEANPGKNIELAIEPDPNNIYDPNAIKVLLNGKQIGFVPAELSKEIRPLVMEYSHLTFGKFGYWNNGYTCQLTICFSNTTLPSETSCLPCNKDLPKSCYSKEAWKRKTEFEREAHSYYVGGGTRAAHEAGTPEGFIRYTDKKYEPTFSRVIGCFWPGCLYSIIYGLPLCSIIAYLANIDRDKLGYLPFIIGYIIAFYLEFQCSTKIQNLVFGTTWRGLIFSFITFCLLAFFIIYLPIRSIFAIFFLPIAIGFFLAFLMTIKKMKAYHSLKEVWEKRSEWWEDIMH